MGFFRKLDRASVLFNGMTDRLGVSSALEVAQPSGAAAYRSALLRCSGCAEAAACAGWQMEHAHALEAPAYCRNRQALAALHVD